MRKNEETPLLPYQSDPSHSKASRAAFWAKWLVLLASIAAAVVVLGRPFWIPSPPTAEDASPYTHFQLFGFQIYTGGAPAFLEAHEDATNTSTTVRNPECRGRPSFGVLGGTEAMCYLGLPDPVEDVRARLEILRQAVERAYAARSDTTDKTLQIFVAPEFFFRGLDGAYRFEPDQASCGALCTMLQGLERIVADARFVDWLFVFGTAVASEVLPHEDAYDYTFYNFSPIYRGYDPAVTAAPGARFLLPKRYVSKIDFLTPWRHVSDALAQELVDEPIRAAAETTVRNPRDFHQYRYDHNLWVDYKQELSDLGYTMIDFGWIQLEGISMTMEICYDHLKRTALTTYLADAVTGSTTLIPSAARGKPLEYVPIPQHQAQISLVSSAGMEVHPASLALVSGGTIFLQDGLFDGDSVVMGDADETCVGSDCLKFDGGTEAVRRRAVFNPHDVFFEHELVQSFEKLSIYTKPGDWAERVKNLFSAQLHEPMIAVYEPAKIAPIPSK